MKTTCEYCGSEIETSVEKCPSCGATNVNYVKTSISQPKTIAELKEWYKEKNLPDEKVTRFFIGKDVKDSKAFGIYCDSKTNKFVVYKNKADGTRAVRYEGDDEEYAVNEIFQKLRETMSVQKAMNVKLPKSGSSNTYQSKKKTKYKPDFTSLKIGVGFVIVLIIAAIIYGCVEEMLHPMANKYFKYKGDYYYNFNDNFYYYDEDLNDWVFYDDEAPFNSDDYKDYQVTDDSFDEYSDFKDTDYYQEWYDSQTNSNDDDDDWDSGWDSNDSWDSDYGSDWDSDW